MMHKTPGDARTANAQLNIRKPRLSTRQGGETPDVRTDTRKCDSTSSSKAGYRGCCIHHCKVVAPLKQRHAKTVGQLACRIHHCRVVAPLKREFVGGIQILYFRIHRSRAAAPLQHSDMRGNIPQGIPLRMRGGPIDAAGPEHQPRPR